MGIHTCISSTISSTMTPSLWGLFHLRVNKPFFKDLDFIFIVGCDGFQFFLIINQHSFHFFHFRFPWVQKLHKNDTYDIKISDVDVIIKIYLVQRVNPIYLHHTCAIPVAKEVARDNGGSRTDDADCTGLTLLTK